MITHTNELVINWHITNRCNFDCVFCFAKWQGKCHEKELITNQSSAIHFLNELYQFFAPGNNKNPLSSALTWSSIRLNFAGGEPLLLGKNLVTIMQEAKRIGFQTSLITNGSKLSESNIEDIAKNTDMIGFSIDSNLPEVNIRIGRKWSKEKTIDTTNLIYCIKKMKELNPEIKIKVNTVVNKLNYTEDLTHIINSIRPHKWKLLKVLPLIDDTLSISDLEFFHFVDNHHELKDIISIEDNDDMIESYLMIDPHGRFFQNKSLNQQYLYSDPIPEVGADIAFKQTEINSLKFASRYL